MPTAYNDYAPVAMFAYNRPNHLQQTLAALAVNEGAAFTELYIFCDGPKQGITEEKLNDIQRVHQLANSETRFKKVNVVIQPQNKGLANSIIEGVTNVLNSHHKIIVLEDDILAGKHFLSYMNESLARYEDNNKIKQVSAFAFDLDFPKKNACYFIPLTTTWGWATWQRAWTEIDFMAAGYEVLHENRKLRSRFNLNDSYDYSTMLFEQMEKNTIDSWGIRYWWSVFKSGGLVLHPDHSMVQNIGFDHSGVHCADDSIADINNWNSQYLINSFPEKIKHEPVYFKALQKFLKAAKPAFRTSLLKRVKIKIKGFLAGKKMASLMI